MTLMKWHDEQQSDPTSGLKGIEKFHELPKLIPVLTPVYFIKMTLFLWSKQVMGSHLELALWDSGCPSPALF